MGGWGDLEGPRLKATRCGGGGGGGGESSLSGNCIGETSREMGREDEMLCWGTNVEGDRSGSTDARGEIPRVEGLDDTDEGRDESEPWFLTADA